MTEHQDKHHINQKESAKTDLKPAEPVLKISPFG